MRIGAHILALSVAFASSALTEQLPATLVLPAGATVRLKAVDTTSSKTTHVGDPVRFTVGVPLRVDGLVVVARGTPVEGRVTAVDKKGSWGRGGGIEIKVGTVRAISGETIQLQGTVGQRGDESFKPSNKEIAGAMLNPLGPLLLLGPFIRGDDLVLHAGSTVGVVVAAYTQLDRTRVKELQSTVHAERYATVFFYDEETYRSCVLCTPLYCGGVKIGSLGAVRARLSAGHYSCRVGPAAPLEFDVAEGEEYYVRATEIPGGWVKGKGSKLTLLPGADHFGVADEWAAQKTAEKNTKDLTSIDPAQFIAANKKK